MKAGEGRGNLSEEGGSTPTVPSPLPKPLLSPSKNFHKGRWRVGGMEMFPLGIRLPAGR